ncbi:MAG TPA: O-antigen ligase family protein [Tepidisphaeraceae bacterium]|nr:O-antigen ligase family protein [Tepidisphaeraceae bacterium]
MSTLFIGILFISAIVITLQRGAAITFAILYLPILLLLSSVRRIGLPGLPDMSSTYGIIYGILTALVIKGGEPMPIRWNLADTLMIAMVGATVISGIATDKLWTGVNIAGEQFFNYLAPYFLARMAFQSGEARRLALRSCIIAAFVIAFFALIEVRLRPYFYSRMLKPFGMFTGTNTMVLHRFGLMRALTTFDHPIDMGNGCLLLTGLIAIFATTTTVGLKNRWVQLGLCAALGSAFCSLSFTAFMGLFTAIGLFIMFRYFKFTMRILPLVYVAMVVGGIFAMSYLNTMKLSEEHPEDASLSSSLWMRATIVQQCWPFCTDAGWFGWGKKIKKDQLDLDSVDNTYLLFIMRRGWLFLVVFLLIPFFLTVRASKAYARTWLPSQRLPLIAGVTTVLAIMVAMFTVWFGFVYSVLWVVTVGLVASIVDKILAVQTSPVPATHQQAVSYMQPGMIPAGGM